mgnify:FL=1
MKTLFWLTYPLSFIVFVISSILWYFFEVGGVWLYLSFSIFLFCIILREIYSEKLDFPHKGTPRHP